MSRGSRENPRYAECEWGKHADTELARAFTTVATPLPYVAELSPISMNPFGVVDGSDVSLTQTQILDLQEKAQMAVGAIADGASPEWHLPRRVRRAADLEALIANLDMRTAVVAVLLLLCSQFARRSSPPSPLPGTAAVSARRPPLSGAGSALSPPTFRRSILTEELAT
jgi:hypothetical protein